MAYSERLGKMKKELYAVYFESANYAGYGEWCLVWASDEEDARDEASPYAEEFYREQDESELNEDYAPEEMEGMMFAAIMEVFPLSADKGADIRRYMRDESQKHFYPIVN